MATASRRLAASTPSSTVVVKRVTFSQPPAAAAAVATSRTALNGKEKVKKEGKKKRRDLIKVKEMSQPLLDSVSGTTDDPSKKATIAHETAPGRADSPEGDASGGPTSCPDYFSVKSYLHNFYESVSVKNPDMYEELEGGDYRYLIRPKKPRCKSLWWKIAVWSGLTLLVVGVIVILVGYLVPRRPIVIGNQDDLEVIDRTALGYNLTLDNCKLLGLIVFCVGGTVVAIALLFPSFLYNYCDEDWATYAEPFKVGTSSEEELAPQSPTEKKIPVTEELTRIQPLWGENDQDEGGGGGGGAGGEGEGGGGGEDDGHDGTPLPQQAQIP